MNDLLPLVLIVTEPALRAADAETQPMETLDGMDAEAVPAVSAQQSSISQHVVAQVT